MVRRVIENKDTNAVEEFPAVVQITGKTAVLIQKCSIDDGVVAHQALLLV